MPTTWTVSIDWNRDGDFSDTGENVTADVISANWFIGMREPYADMADNSKLELVLDNTSKNYSPENAGGTLANKVRPFRPVRIESNNGTLRTMWTGWIESIQPDVNQYGQRRVTITAAGSMQFYRSAETDIDIQVDQKTDQIVKLLLEQVVIPPPLEGMWFLELSEPGIPASQLGVNTRLSNPGTNMQLEVGQVTLALAADNWVSRQRDREVNFNVYRAIADVVAAERGRFYFDRTGKAIFWNRLHINTGIAASPALTLTNNMVGMQYTYAGLDYSFKNEVTVTCHPRTLSDTNTKKLWNLDKPVDIPAGQTIVINAPYRDKDLTEARIGGMEVYIENTTFSAGTADIILKPKASSAKIKIINNGGVTATLATATIRGRKITDFGQMDSQSEDTKSIALYGRRTLSMSLLSIESLDYAKKISDFEISRRASPRGYATQVTLRSHGLNGGGNHTSQLSLSIGSVIRITESQTQHTSQKYYIIGESHKLTESATNFETTWYLEPVPTAAFSWT